MLSGEKLGILQWAVDDRPREKLRTKGAMSLSDAELLSIIIRNGTKNKSAFEIAQEILHLCKNNLPELGRLSVKDLMRIRGMGMTKSVMVMAALELGRRRHASDQLPKPVITGSTDIARYLQTRFQDLNHEIFAVVFLNRGNRIIDIEIVSSGGLTGTVADPRIILKKALEEEAVSIILCHNHPSGNLKPSRADEELTYRIRDAAKLLDIRLLDHVIVSSEGWFSFADDGLI
ncbi:RadC family protein [Pollutibacter soli]|uniref:RadC family protein n=1 Tax=Pollutibacter soli TaxID=3034157 RepID=UPI0030137781